MNIQQISQNSFKGYDVRPLKGFIMNTNVNRIAEEMDAIGRKEGFKIFGIKENGNKVSICSAKNTPDTQGRIWAQDMWSVVKGSLLVHRLDEVASTLKSYLKLRYNLTQQVVRSIQMDKLEKKKDFWTVKTLQAQEDAHIPGGNIFLVKGREQEEVIVGEDDLKMLDSDDILGMYYTDKITVLPQMDYHLDLFIRPLNDKRILLADDNLALSELKKIHSVLLKNPNKYANAIERTSQVIEDFEQAIDRNKRPHADEIEKILKKSGYKTIRVPGRVYDIDTFEGLDGFALPQHYCNFINANVLKNKKGKLVYITNKSKIDEKLGLTPKIIEETGCSFEKAFRDSITPYVGKNHIYFVSGEDNIISELLTKYQGGIHCLCSEVP